MHLQRHKPPHIRSSDNFGIVLLDVIVAIIPLFVMAVFYYGIRVLMVGLVSVATCVICDVICIKIRKMRIRKNDYSAIITGLIIACLLPAAVPYYVVIAAGAFAILIAKHPFGGFGLNPFNPSAAGVAFVSLCWPARAYAYTAPFEKLPVFGYIWAKTVEDTATSLKFGGLPTHDILDLLRGNVAGPIGTTSVLVILACAIFLIVRKSIAWQVTVSFVGVSALIAFIFSRVAAERSASVLYELCSGSLMFGAVFVATEPVTSPRLKSSKLIYGALCAILTFIFRHKGAYAQGLVFAVLITNTFSTIIDKKIYRIIYLNRTEKGWFKARVIGVIRFLLISIKNIIYSVIAVFRFFTVPSFRRQINANSAKIIDMGISDSGEEDDMYD
ncbi:MAG: RnfABCDGE type electron transport complex subunit D [Oscillospiraceae bacterium]|nr:RnfABCDGE type electron transport complex subunit D [Oscillospiraceae bacterium]